MRGSRFLKIGVTGGIGSGKSTICGALSENGLALVDADQISRALTEPGGDAIAAIAASFGTRFIREDGAMDRETMRRVVFEDSTARMRLEAIIHPLVRRNVERKIEEAQIQGMPAVVCEIPLLAEGKTWVPQLDCILVVDCPPALQVQRVMARSALAEEAILKIIASQATRAQRLACADAVILNESIGLVALKQELGLFLRALGLVCA